MQSVSVWYQIKGPAVFAYKKEEIQIFRMTILSKSDFEKYASRIVANTITTP